MRGILTLAFFLGFYQGIFAASESGVLSEEVKAFVSARAKYRLEKDKRLGINQGDREEVHEMLGSVVEASAEDKGAGRPPESLFFSRELREALKSGDIAVVKSILGGFDLHQLAETYDILSHFLITAVMNERAELVDFFTSCGTDVNIKVNGYSALHHAVIKGNSEIINKLLAANAMVDTPNCDKETALHLASERGRTEACNQLIAAAKEAKEVDAVEYVNAQNSRNLTALSIAIDRGDYETVKVLLEAGADLNAVTDSVIGRVRCKTMRKLLREYGARWSDRECAIL